MPTGEQHAPSCTGVSRSGSLNCCGSSIVSSRGLAKLFRIAAFIYTGNHERNLARVDSLGQGDEHQIFENAMKQAALPV